MQDTKSGRDDMKKYILSIAIITAAAATGSAGDRGCGSRKVRPCDPHANWGTMVSLQDPFVTMTLNGFFRERGQHFGLPPDLTVRNHPNGHSLIYEWDSADGTKMAVQQTARPSVWFTVVSVNGVLINAQERDWGFVTTFRRFSRKSVFERAERTLHEFIHQFKQIGTMGNLCYWTSYSLQFLTRGYSRIGFEKEAHAVSMDYRRYITELCRLQYLNAAPVRRCH